MGRLTKQEAKLHGQACDLVALDRPLTDDERCFVLDNWQEAATAAHGLDGAYFTPEGLADVLVQFHIVGERVIDLCAGIGRLAYAFYEGWVHDPSTRDRWWNGERPTIVCVEKNPQYVKVGRRVLPEATWICADVLDLPGMDLGGRFTDAISNPPFGPISRVGNAPRYRGRKFEYHVIDVAAHIADHGAFIVPQNSAPFRYSGIYQHFWVRNGECQRFEGATGITLGFNTGIDTTDFADQWRGVKPAVEIVAADFTKTELPTQKAKPPTPILAELAAVTHAQDGLFPMEEAS